MNIQLLEIHPVETAELIEAAQYHVVYLPTYLPDLNHIEKRWAWLKSHIY
ncbi:MAG: hypothetical protein EA367_05760 [Leptolyngbya sp. DLM2.Bin15]|nr:MAG: hypothetical protein EA367_05760 [Leptolyngbya sp. DLM2.Bin15]